MVLIAGHTAVVIALHLVRGFPPRLQLTIPWITIVTGPIVYCMAAALFLLGHAVVVEGASLRRLSTWRSVARSLFEPGPTAAFLVILLLFPYWIRTFIALKATIPSIQPFVWDSALMEWDRYAHFGHHPWMLVQAFVGTPLITRFIDVTYTTWFTVLWITFIWQAWHGSRRSPLRLQFLISFVLCWLVLGLLAAMLFSSAGPVYFADVTGGNNPYSSLLEYLHAVDLKYPLNAVRLHDVLWTAYVDPTRPPQGIAAMPSVHVAVTILMVLLGFRTHRLIGLLYLVFAVLIFIGSIHLAWHYAIDGYAGAIGALAVWYVSGRFSRWWAVRSENASIPDARPASTR